METKALTTKRELQKITFNDVKKYLCPKAADPEISLFLKTAESLNLNPFAREVYLIKYDEDSPAAIVIAIDAFLKAAENSVEYNGHEAGIIIKPKDGTPEFREGTFMLENDGELVGGWAKTYRKDREHPFYTAVNIKEYQKYRRDGKVTRFWAEMPATKIRNVALKHSLKEAFPNLFSGLYVEAEFEPVKEGELPPAFENSGEPEWKRFWVKVKKELHLNEADAHSLLKVKSIKEDLIERQGKTLEQVFDMLVDTLGYKEPDEQADNIELVWLQDTLAELKWNRNDYQTARTFINSKYKTDTSGTIVEVMGRLSRQQQEELTRLLQEKVNAPKQLL